IDALELVAHVAPVQLALRLLVVSGSRLLELPEVRALVGPFDRERLCHPWRHPDPAVDAMQQAVEACVREAVAAGGSRPAVFDRVRAVAGAHGAAGDDAGVARAGRAPKRAPVPYLTEPWYC